LEPITTTIETVKAVLELLKSLRGMAKEIKNAGLNEKLVEFQAVILDLQGRLSELEKAELSNEVKSLRDQAALKRNIYSRCVTRRGSNASEWHAVNVPLNVRHQRGWPEPAVQVDLLKDSDGFADGARIGLRIRYANFEAV